MEQYEQCWYHPPVLVLLGGILFIPARGGLDVAAMNSGSVYFSRNLSANHIAVNQVWNFLYSFERMSSLKNPYVFMDQKQALSIYNILSQCSDSSVSVLNTKHPNVIFILMESFESDITKTLGGRDGITPHFDSLTHEGILFSNMIASGTRTDKGFVSVLSGYPAQSVNPIIKFTRKIEKLPTISKELSNYGYNSIFVYGGNKQFTNMNSLIMAGGFADVTDVSDFNTSLRTFKWGVHDEYVFDRSIERINESKKPFFTFIMSLSNHEPFEVPTKKQFKGDNDEKLFYNSSFYADSCLGLFIAKAKKQPWWNNTLIVLVADHASIIPGNKGNESIARYRIPMLWLGGALRVTDTIVKKYCSQTDIVKTVLHQMGKPDSAFLYSKNIFNSKNKGYALFCYNDGFGLISDSYCQIFDNTTSKYLIDKGTFHGKDSLIGKAFWQVVNDDFVKK
jgi:phosphoglycerol transferase MdoB-like AlkP superfamily enzyme